MERSTIIASAIAAGGILIAGTVAGTAVINAATSTSTESADVTVVAADSGATPATVLPALDSQPLPAITVPTDAAPKTSESTKPAVQVEQSANIPASRAAASILDAAGGGVVSNIEPVSRGGHQAWAVTVSRQDGSVVTGFEDRATGVVFDWVVVTPAPAPATAYAENGSGEYAEHEGEEHEEEHGQYSENEHHEDGDDD